MAIGRPKSDLVLTDAERVELERLRALRRQLAKAVLRDDLADPTAPREQREEVLDCHLCGFGQ
jgi:hypothetical protein